MYKQLNREQRYSISAFLRAGYKPAQIARELGVAASTITREIKRNSSEKLKRYHPDNAQEWADIRKERVRRNRRIPGHIKNRCIKLLQEHQWSPEQISGHLALQGIKVSHETIYRWIRQDKANQGDLYKHCRHRLKHRKRPVGKVSTIPNRRSIHELPAEANGQRIGDFQMDLILGAKGKGAILTVTDRMTNMIWAKKLESKTSSEVNDKLWAILIPYKRIIKTIVTDNGTEFSGHEQITKKLGVPIYFADPYSSWQKGAIEHANKLIRQYIPKDADFSKISQKKIDSYSKKINARPRRKLRFDTPANVFFSALS